MLHAVNCSLVGLFAAKVCRPHAETDSEEHDEPTLHQLLYVIHERVRTQSYCTGEAVF